MASGMTLESTGASFLSDDVDILGFSVILPLSASRRSIRGALFCSVVAAREVVLSLPGV